MANHRHGMEVSVVMVTFPTRGNINPLLHLSRLVCAYNIPVHFIDTTTVHNREAKARVHGWDPNAIANLHFHEFPTPQYFEDLPPEPNATTTKSPSNPRPLSDAIMRLRQPVYEFVKGISSMVTRVVVIHDTLTAYVVQDIHSISNAESYYFRSSSAFFVYTFYRELAGKPIQSTDDEILNQVPPIKGCIPQKFVEFVKLQQGVDELSSGDLYNASRVVEGHYLDLLAKEKTTGTDKLWAVGPFNPVELLKRKGSNDDHKCLEWLDKQPPNSVILVSFGSTSSFSNEEIKELALGLENSEQKFIWVLRDAEKGHVSEEDARRLPLPEGYEERVKGRGLIVREWAPQLEILGHLATGGFLSHCGWNSCSESISMGVPMATWPMQTDQPRNAILITKVLKIGVQVREWVHRDEVVSSTTIEKAVRRLMDSVEGKEMRQRAAELSDAVKKSVREGGAARNEMDSFIAHITRYI